MATSSCVKVLEHCWISPASGAPTRFCTPLTFFDLIWLALSPVQRLIFYELDCSKPNFTDSIVPNLKTSLSLTLTKFFPLAGNVTWPTDSVKPEIVYVTGDSVSFTACESNADFHHLASHQGRSSSELYPLIPQLPDMSVNREFRVLALQVTLFPNKGMCVGITFRHTVVDGKVIFQFIKSWASLSRSKHDGDTDTSLLLADTQLCYDRSIVNDANGIDMIYLESFKKLNVVSKDSFFIPRNDTTPTDKVLATFILRASEIKKLKKWVMNHSGQNKSKQTFSTFVVISGYVWVCWIKARYGEDKVMDDDPTDYFLFPIDCREKLDPPIPATYFGNCVNGGLAECKRSDLVGKNGIAIAAEAVKNIIETNSAHDKIMEYMETLISRIHSIQRGRILPVAGSTRFGVYEVDFGWGKPKSTEVVSIMTTGAFALSETPTEVGAVQISLALKVSQMEAFTSLFASTIQGIP